MVIVCQLVLRAASWRRHPACRAATLGSAGELRSPKPAKSRLRAKLPALQGPAPVFITIDGPQRPIPTGVDARPTSWQATKDDGLPTVCFWDCLLRTRDAWGLATS